MPDYPIKPSDIRTDGGPFWETFGNMETETSAMFLVRLAQQNGDWRNFTKDEIDAFCQHDFWFNGLSGTNSESALIRQNEDGSYSFTHKFIAKCFLTCPANQIVS